MVRASPLRTGRLYPQEFSWHSFLEAESTPGHIMSVAWEKTPSDTTGDRSRDPPTSSDEPIPRPEESYLLRCVIVCDLESWSMRRPWPALGCCARNNKFIPSSTVQRSVQFVASKLVHTKQLQGTSIMFQLHSFSNSRVFKNSRNTGRHRMSKMFIFQR